MSQLLLDAQERAAALWTMGRWRLAFLSFASLWMAWGTATNQVDMSKLGWFDWFQTFGGCIGNWSIMMAALLATQGKAVASGHIPGLEDIDDPEQPEVRTTTLTTTTVTPPTASITAPVEPAEPQVKS
jgi:hypothetical protein